MYLHHFFFQADKFKDWFTLKQETAEDKHSSSEPNFKRTAHTDTISAPPYSAGGTGAGPGETVHRRGLHRVAILKAVLL